MKCIALDDEMPALQIIETFAKENELIAQINTFSRTGEALLYLESHPVDVLFLDIQMPAMSGIDFLKKLEHHPLVIFTTSHMQYAVESYEFNAVDYLLKPFTQKRFDRAIQKAHDQLKTQKETTLDFSKQNFTVKLDYGVKHIPIPEILFIQSWDNYIKIILKNNDEVVVRKTLKEALDELPNDTFLQIHRSYIANITKVTHFKNKKLKIGENEIPVSKSYQDQILKLF